MEGPDKLSPRPYVTSDICVHWFIRSFYYPIRYGSPCRSCHLVIDSSQTNFFQSSVFKLLIPSARYVMEALDHLHTLQSTPKNYKIIG